MDSNYTENDLIVMGESKLGIFNRNTNKYVTERIYDKISLSLSGSHVVWNFKNGDINGEIEYCAIVKTDGTIIETPDLIFRQGGFNDYEHAANIELYNSVVAIAYSKSLNKHFLVNTNGEKISEGFDRIGKHFAENELFEGYNYEDEKQKIIKDYKILNRFGEVLDIKTNHQYHFEEYLDLMKKYGPVLTMVLPCVPSSISQLIKIINAGIEYNKKSSKERQSDILWFITALGHLLKYKKIELDVDFNDIDFDLSYQNLKIAESYNNKQLIKELFLPIYYFNTALQYGKIFGE